MIPFHGESLVSMSKVGTHCMGGAVPCLLGMCGAMYV